MPLCAKLVTVNLGLTKMYDSATGQLFYGPFVVLDSSTTDLSTCAYVVETGAEYSGWSQLWSMTPDDALVISISVALLWAGAWGFRAIRESLFNPERNQDD